MQSLESKFILIRAQCPQLVDIRTFIIITVLCLLTTPALAQNVKGDYPICTSQQDIKDFNEAKIFSDFEKMATMVEDGKCTFVEPGIKASILEPHMFPKVLVFIPYKAPLTGYTAKDNFD